MTLSEVLDEAGSTVDRLDRRESDGAVEFLVGGRSFAALTGDTAEFRLEPAVARAALGTPDTTASSRGPEWVAFRPLELDRFATDRASAWFLSAWRRARG
ncbi:MAG TPA: hypothetical protein VGQ58_04875 [Candidatus Limnocylindrales bacterium]|jgi:hypothetical protein|nr:hypothetical protein [Candidatus Limnocylindrales bacterium]